MVMGGGVLMDRGCGGRGFWRWGGMVMAIEEASFPAGRFESAGCREGASSG